MALLKVKREKDYSNNSLRDYTIFLDGEEAGAVGNDSEFDIEVEGGIHEICVGIDWCKTKPLKFDLEENETSTFECGSNLKGYRWFFHLLYYVIFKSDEYLFVSKV